ncbi:iron-containing redox enzyme family protein [Cellulomonas endophytica]|uniref:iron-containing redox enzyme family protein n=1 Tax=Cellulomonas endophytica TaxID=2494735 RepID=UPI001012B424|nr:iron-containing redox enzyme family protein [Cellulomonas endophytica]
MPLPAPRGPASAALLDLLTTAPADADVTGLDRAVGDALVATEDVLRDEDLQLTLLCLYELHYGGLTGVDDAWEWSPALLGVRARIEAVHEAALRDRVPVPEVPDDAGAGDVAETLFALAAEDTGPGLSTFVARRATLEQVRELLAHRSLYHLKEADPHTWAIPRLQGRPKAALVEVQSDEYGGGDPERMHSALFARTMRALGLDDRPGAYLDHVPALTLASLNSMSLFGLHRRLRGAVAGHLAAFEMTSSVPNRLYGNGFRRLGFDEDATLYFDEHVEADAVHEQIAGRDLAGALAAQEPEVRDDVLFGAAACLALDTWVAQAQVGAWSAGRSSLLHPLPDLVPAALALPDGRAVPDGTAVPAGAPVRVGAPVPA